MMSGTRRKDGPLGPFVDGFRARLLALGYTPGSARFKLREVGQLGRWMAAGGLGVGRLDATVIDAFLAARRVRGLRPALGVRSFAPLLCYLRGECVIGAEPAASLTVLDAFVERYRGWLVVERGLAAATVLRYETLARRFLAESCRDADLVAAVAGLTGADVNGFLLSECGRLSLGSAKGRVAELRSLLRFLHVEGLTTLGLAAAVPPVAGWRYTSLPAAIGATEARKLVAACAGAGAMARRDYAMLTLLTRLGLRSIEIARLELDDLDWRCGEIVVRGKARRRDRLPLPADVGEALVAYLTDGRPRTDERRVFLTCRAPSGPIRADLVGDVVRRACLRAGLVPVGAHRLRHTVATELLRQGATLVEIGQLLRHRDLATTAIYAKVDLDALRIVAQPWPGGV